MLPQFTQDADRHGVVEADDRGYITIAQLLGAGDPTLTGERLRDHGEFGAGGTCSLAQARDAIGDGVEFDGPGDDADALMSELCEMLADRDSRAMVVRQYGINGQVMIVR